MNGPGDRKIDSHELDQEPDGARHEQVGAKNRCVWYLAPPHPEENGAHDEEGGSFVAEKSTEPAEAAATQDEVEHRRVTAELTAQRSLVPSNPPTIPTSPASTADGGRLLRRVSRWKI